VKARFWNERREDGRLGLQQTEANALPPEMRIRYANAPIERGLDLSTEHVPLSTRTSAA
jgi:hypothetical protein